MERTRLVKQTFYKQINYSLVATTTERNTESYWENNLIDFVNRLNPLLFSDKFKYSELDPTALSFGDKDLYETRKKLVTSALKNGRSSNKMYYID